MPVESSDSLSDRTQLTLSKCWATSWTREKLSQATGYCRSTDSQCCSLVRSYCNFEDPTDDAIFESEFSAATHECR